MEEQIAIVLPTTYRAYRWFILFLNHWVVLVTFLVYFIFVFNLRRTFMNGLTLVIVMWLFAIYLTQGLPRLLTYWRVLTFYQAFVLSVLLVF
jgi:hypothetical protein